jgi:hypothetical protein
MPPEANPDTTPTPATPTAPGSAPAAPETSDDRRPPWERTGEAFDPARAWTLIERLRADLGAAKSAPPTVPAAPTAVPPAPVAPETAPTGTGGWSSCARAGARTRRPAVRTRRRLADLSGPAATGDHHGRTSRGPIGKPTPPRWPAARWSGCAVGAIPPPQSRRPTPPNSPHGCGVPTSQSWR